MQGLDLEKALERTKAKEEARHPDTVLAAFKKLLHQDDALDDALMAKIFGQPGENKNLKLDQLDPARIYSARHIKKLCTQYRLRFLDGQYFKGDIPQEALGKLKRLQRDQGAELGHFKIVAPAPMFNLEYKDKDPLMLLPLGKDRYYLVHKWGNDLSRWRKYMVFPFRNFKTLLASVALLAALVVSLFPSSMLMGPYDTSSLAIRVIFFFYLFIAFSGLTALYGFSRMKNFNSELWNSRYLD